MKIKAKTNYYDTQEKRNVLKDEIYDVSPARAKQIISCNFAELVIEEEKKNESKNSKKRISK